MILRYSGKSSPSALLIADAWSGIELVRHGAGGDVNWGREKADTELNPDITNATNKRVMRELFEERGVPMPKLYYCPGYAIDQGITIVGRPDRHMKGRGFWKCETREDVLKALKGTKRKKAATHWMEFIESDHEYRVHIFKGKSIRISEKKAGESGATSHGDYITIKPTGNVKHVRKAAKKAVKALGLDFGAVDILATEDKCWVLECNSSPGLGGSMPALYAKVFKEWYDNRNN